MQLQATNTTFLSAITCLLTPLAAKTPWPQFTVPLFQMVVPIYQAQISLMMQTFTMSQEMIPKIFILT
jgi:hypothetical protein